MKVKFENPHGAITEEIEARFETFVEGVNEKVAKYYAEQFPTLDPEHVVVSPNGRTYWKLIKEKIGVNSSIRGREQQSSVVCIVELALGGVCPAASNHFAVA